MMEKRRRGSNVQLALVAGVFCATGSLFGKLAGGVIGSTWGSLLLSGVLFAVMIISNTLGCRFYVKALNASGSSLPPTIASTVSNYICSALMGVLFFGETTSLKWWCGTSLILLGLFLICYDPSARKDESCESAKEEDNENADERKLKQQ